MNSVVDIDQFLNTNNISLDPPLFYGNKFSLRFELGGDISTDNIARVEQATERSCAIFQTISNANDSQFLIVEAIGARGASTDELPDFLQQFIDIPVQDLFGVTEEELKDEDDDELSRFRYVARIDNSSLRVRNLFRAKIVAELPFNESEPSFHQRCFLINCSTAVCFHIYDDRGLDVVAPEKELLQRAYEQHNEWLLDHDRKRMNRIFASQITN